MNKNMRFPAGLFICLIIQCLTGGCIGVKEWVCTSKYSEYTKQYCKDSGPTKGCYFVPHFNEYRSCSTICNNVRTMSLDEGKCNDLCGGYLSGYGDCIPTDATVSAELSFTTATNVQSVTSLVRGTTVFLMYQQSLPPWAVVVVVVVVVAIIAVSFVLLAIWKKKCCCADKAIPQPNHRDRETISTVVLDANRAENGRASRTPTSTGNTTGMPPEMETAIVDVSAQSNGEAVRDGNSAPVDTAYENGNAHGSETAARPNTPTGNNIASENRPTALPSLTITPTKPIQASGPDGTCTDTNDHFNRVPSQPTSPTSGSPTPIQLETDETSYLLEGEEHSSEAVG